MPEFSTSVWESTWGEGLQMLNSVLGGREARHELLLDVRRHEVVVRELHGVGRAALGDGAQRGHVLEHVGQRHARADGLRVAALAEVAHESAARVDVADDPM